MHAIGRSASSPSNAIFHYFPIPTSNVRNFHSGAAGHYVEQICRGNAISFVYILKYVFLIISKHDESNVYYNTCSPVPVILPATFLAPGMVSKMVSSGARESAQPMMAV
jgi:hypothetical protein